MTPDEAVGLIVSFIADPRMVKGCMLEPGAKQLVGEVIYAEGILNGLLEIPSLKLTIRGRSGKTMDIDQVDNHVRFHKTWEDAIKDAQL